jgi:hypothetical protein
MAKPLRFKDFTVANYTQSGDEEQDYEAQKRKRHIPTGNTGEALDFTARQKRSRQFKKYKAKIALGRKKAARRFASQEVLKKRARKAARMALMKKLTKDIPKDELSFARRQEIEKRLDKMGTRIDKMARKLLPQMRKKELERKRGKSDN